MNDAPSTTTDERRNATREPNQTRGSANPQPGGPGRNERLGDMLDRGIFLAFDVMFVPGADGKPKSIPKPSAKLLNGSVLTLCGCLEAAGIVGVPHCDEKNRRSGWVFMAPRELQSTPDGATAMNVLKATLTRVDAWELLEAAADEIPAGFFALLDSIADADK